MINFLDLGSLNSLHSKELKKTIAEVIDSGFYINGKNVDEFEKDLCSFVGTNYSVGVGNGYDALRLIFKAYIELGVLSVGDEVIVPAHTFIASVLAITENGLKPILIEPDESTYNINIEKLKLSITKKTKAILLVHLYGRICWNDELKKLSSENNIIIIEDNAQAIGAQLNNKFSGSFGHSSAFSFYPGKNLGALGDAGAVATNDETLYNVIKSISNYGGIVKYNYDYKGLNSRMDEIQAAILKIKLKFIENENNRRREIAKIYCENIKNDKIVMPINVDSNFFNSILRLSHVWHLFVVRTKNRDEFQNFLFENNIQTLIHYPIPIHKQNCYPELNSLHLPISESISNEILSLPISPVLSDSDALKIAEIINKF